MNITLAIKTVLVNAGIADASIKRNNVPDSPADIIVISDTGGITPDANDTSISEKQNKTFQVLVRGTDHDTVLGVCDQVRAALIGRVAVEAGDVTLKNIIMQNEFQSIGKDAVGRWEYTANFSTLAVEVTA